MASDWSAPSVWFGDVRGLEHEHYFRADPVQAEQLFLCTYSMCEQVDTCPPAF